jgi:hypothetical protein
VDYHLQEKFLIILFLNRRRKTIKRLLHFLGVHVDIAEKLNLRKISKTAPNAFRERIAQEIVKYLIGRQKVSFVYFKKIQLCNNLTRGWPRSQELVRSSSMRRKFGLGSGRNQRQRSWHPLHARYSCL